METIEMPDIQKIEIETAKMVVFAEEIRVVSQEEYVGASEHHKLLKRAQKRVIELFDAPKSAAKRAHAAICDAERKLLDPLKRASEICEGKITIYLKEIKRRDEEEARRRREEEERKARAEAEAAMKKQEDERIALAAQLEKEGFQEEAQAVIEKPVIAPIVQVTPPRPVAERPKIDGQHLRTNHRAEVYDLAILVGEVAAGRQPLSLILPNEKALNQMARALKAEMRIPGVKVVEETSVIQKDL